MEVMGLMLGEFVDDYTVKVCALEQRLMEFFHALDMATHGL